MKVVVGLGNPGQEYDDTPHNAGFEVVDEIVREAGVKLKKSWRFPMVSVQIRVGGHEVLLVKPLLRKKGVTPADLLVLVDDVELPLGSVRLRAKGSAGTHNGLKSLIERVGTTEFPRLRIGIGPVPDGRDRVSYVLGKYPKDVRKKVDELKSRSAEAVLCWIAEGVDRAMNKFNS
jgi:PTH1 family peptidyl-tRNA hydrolase